MVTLKKLLGSLIVVLAVCILPATGYCLTVSGLVLDGSDDSAIADVDVYIYSESGGTQLFVGTTDASGSYSTDIDDSTYSTVYITFTIGTYVDTFGTFSVQAQLDTVYLAATGGGAGTIDGRTTDAATADDFIAEVFLSLYSGINTTSGTAVYTTTSKTLDTDPTPTAPKTFEFTGVTPGTYTLLAEKEGFADAKVNVVAIDGDTNDYSVRMSRSLGSGYMRIVLSWGYSGASGPYPYDLDAYLYTPAIEGQTHIISWQNYGSQLIAPYAILDIDDRFFDDGQSGPETITIYAQHPGTYTYAVQYYDGGGTLGTSAAKVEVYDEHGLYRTYNVPVTAGSNPAETGDEWIVFSFEGSGEGGATSSGIEPIKLEDKITDDCFIETIKSSF